MAASQWTVEIKPLFLIDGKDGSGHEVLLLVCFKNRLERADQ
jgi:hypothetical protein